LASRHREACLERSAFADFAFYVYAAAMRENDSAGLEQADTKPSLLRALKGPE
jgi:hypothetical protein